MAETIEKSVYQIVGNPLCVSADDGLKVSEVISQFIKNKQPIILSFLNVKMLTSAFLNTAIGVLYKDFSENDIKALLTVEDLSLTDKRLLKRVVDTAKLYYSDPERIERSMKEE